MKKIIIKKSQHGPWRVFCRSCGWFATWPSWRYCMRAADTHHQSCWRRWPE